MNCEITDYKAKWIVRDCDGKKLYFNSPKTIMKYFETDLNPGILYDLLRTKMQGDQVSEKRKEKFTNYGILHIYNIKNKVKLF